MTELAPITDLTLPERYADDADVRAVISHLQHGALPLLITGEAGTGKSTLIRYIRTCGAFPKAALLAPTGIAAINISGQTLHSFFRLPPRIIDEGALLGQRANSLWKKVEIIIIDEVSMVRPDILDGMDLILRKARRSQKPFGGVKMLFVGDFYQLPPVVRGQEADILERMGYDTPFAYSAKVFKRYPPRRINLTHIHRQKDERFRAILSSLRQGKYVNRAVEVLNEAGYGPHRAGVTPLVLTATNAAAARYNTAALGEIDAVSQKFIGESTGKFNVSGDKLPVPERLTLKAGARVMALRNDPQKRWVNGSLGTVLTLADNSVMVTFDHSERTHEVESASWETIKYVWNEAAERVDAEITGSYKQMPLNLAWAVTIHKAQGLTLEDVRVDMERGAFAAGQTYVALSRATSLDGLSFSRALTPADIIVERRHAEYLKLDEA
ncbi:MAG: AAA family ATPase [Robiginitomaculum sp.]